MASPVDFMVDLAQIAIEASDMINLGETFAFKQLAPCNLFLFHFSNVSKQLENCFMVQKLTVHASSQQSQKVFHNHP